MLNPEAPIFDEAAKQGVYLKPVVLEKNDLVWNLLNPDGTVNPGWEAGDNANFYGTANAGANQTRRLHEYFFRYLSARWGYSTAVHSWELLNEGNPFNSSHYDLAEAFAARIHQHDRQHLATTSFWHSYPGLEFWHNASYPNPDYADLHAYSSTGPVKFSTDDTAQGYLEYSRWLTSNFPRTKPTIRGETGFICGSETTCDFSADTRGIWLHKFLWSHLDDGFFYDLLWYEETIYDPARQIDHASEFRRFSDFLAGLPLTSGGYQAAGATASDTRLRVIGQKDVALGKAHLWIDNDTTTWRNIVNATGVIAVTSATVSLNMGKPGRYTVSWYDTVGGSFYGMPQAVDADGAGNLTLSIPYPLDTVKGDVAVTVDAQGPAAAVGDVNRDGAVNLADVRELIRMVAGMVPVEVIRGDVNGDGRVNLYDVRALILILVS